MDLWCVGAGGHIGSMSSTLDLTMAVPSRRGESVEQHFKGSAGDWLSESARRSGTAWQVELRLGRLRQPVVASVGDPWIDGDTVWRSLTWTPTRVVNGYRPVNDRRLPTFTGQLGLREGEDRQVLVLRGHYDPPGGPVGTALDTLFLRKVAEITGLQLLGDIVDRLSQPTTIAKE